MTKQPSTIAIPVDGGRLTVHELTTGDGPLVVAVHGITANALSWGPVAARLQGRARVLAPDLRGRGSSRAVGEPRGLGAHAQDVLAVIEATGAEQVVLVGHSMGAFVAAIAAARDPQRVRGLLLVDGGLALPLPQRAADLAPADLIQAVIGPAMARLSMTFDSPQAYLEFWDEHPAIGPALRGPNGPAVRAYLEHDLVRSAAGPGWVSSCVRDHVEVDGLAVLTDTEAATAPARALAAGVPTRLLWAERGLLDEPGGLYTRDRLAGLGLPDGLAVEFVPDTNHYSIVFEPAAELVADRVSELSNHRP